jgi:hypothetical protein
MSGVASALVAASFALSFAAPASAQCVIPYTLTNGQVADATQLMANFTALSKCVGAGGSTNSVQYKAGSSFGGIPPLANGQVAIGATGGPPQGQTLAAGPGITISNGSGSVTIAGNASAAGNGIYSPIMSPTPTSALTGLGTWLNQGSAAVSDSAVGLCIDAPSSGTSANVTGRYMAAPTAPYTITALIAVTRSSTSPNGVGIGWYDGSAKLHLLSYTTAGNVAPTFQVDKWNSITSYNASDFTSSPNAFVQPLWLRVGDDGTNVSFAFSQDGVQFVTVFSVAKASGFLGASGYSNVIFFVNPEGSRTLATVMSWTQS